MDNGLVKFPRNESVLWEEENEHESSFLALKILLLISRPLFVLNDQLFTSRSPYAPDINRCQVVPVLIFSV